MIQQFMRIYMFELEKYLTDHSSELLNISFQSDEANTDRPLKEYIKQVIETDFNSIPNNSKITEVISEDNSNCSFDELKKIFISRVLLPEEINQSISSKLKPKSHSNHTNPDLCLEINFDNTITYETIELKSTKMDSIPGSSIQQINPLEWVIFVKHSSSSVSVVTGQYIHAINEKMQFPDRSPRPQVSFKELQNWNSSNRIFEYTRLIYKFDPNQMIKEKLLNDWQRVLAERWLHMLFDQKHVHANEPWFNNNMRKFIIMFLEKYEKLNDSEKQSFKNSVSSLIDQ